MILSINKPFVKARNKVKKRAGRVFGIGARPTVTAADDRSGFRTGFLLGASDFGLRFNRLHEELQAAQLESGNLLFLNEAVDGRQGVTEIDAQRESCQGAEFARVFVTAVVPHGRNDGLEDGSARAFALGGQFAFHRHKGANRRRDPIGETGSVQLVVVFASNEVDQEFVKERLG